MVDGGNAYLWTVEREGVPHLIAWSPVEDGALRLSFPKSEDEWSPFVKMGGRFGPVPSLELARERVRAWTDQAA